MITIPQVVTEEIKKRPLYLSGMQQGVLNLSAVARDLQPGVERKLQKKVSQNAVLLALQRLQRQNMHAVKKKAQSEPPIYGITISSGVVIINIRSSNRLNIALSNSISNLPEKYLGTFLHVDDGENKVLVIEKRYEDAVRRSMKAAGESADSVTYNASLVSIKTSEKEIADATAYIIRILTWHGIKFSRLSLGLDTVNIVLARKDAHRISELLDQGDVESKKS